MLGLRTFLADRFEAFLSVDLKSMLGDADREPTSHPSCGYLCSKSSTIMSSVASMRAAKGLEDKGMLMVWIWLKDRAIHCEGKSTTRSAGTE